MKERVAHLRDRSNELTSVARPAEHILASLIIETCKPARGCLASAYIRRI
jgi:hypothetical protein